MRLEVPTGKIKIDKAAIHELLGVPLEGTYIYSIESLNKMHKKVAKWRRRYSGRFVTTSSIVKHIEEGEDRDNFNFRLDFLMLFLATMVDCHYQGSCREDILSYITPKTDFGKIDWCGYILEALKGCKTTWRRCDTNSIFSGPLTLLVV